MGKYLIFYINILIALFISTIGGFFGLFWGLTWGNYFGIFFGLFALQFGIGWMWTIYVESKMEVFLADSRAKSALANSIQYIDIVCAYCSSKNSVELLLNKENYFACSACKQNNHVSVAVATERTTKPLEADAIVDIFRKLDVKEVE